MTKLELWLDSRLPLNSTKKWKRALEWVKSKRCGTLTEKYSVFVEYILFLKGEQAMQGMIGMSWIVTFFFKQNKPHPPTARERGGRERRTERESRVEERMGGQCRLWLLCRKKCRGEMFQESDCVYSVYCQRYKPRSTSRDLFLSPSTNRPALWPLQPYPAI